MYKYIFWDGFYCIIFCMEYFGFLLKELRETVEMGISYALENGGYNFLGFIIWKLKSFIPQTKEARLGWGSYLPSIELPLSIRICCRGSLA